MADGQTIQIKGSTGSASGFKGWYMGDQLISGSNNWQIPAVPGSEEEAKFRAVIRFDTMDSYPPSGDTLDVVVTPSGETACGSLGPVSVGDDPYDDVPSGTPTTRYWHNYLDFPVSLKPVIPTGSGAPWLVVTATGPSGNEMFWVRATSPVVCAVPPAGGGSCQPPGGWGYVLINSNVGMYDTGGPYAENGLTADLYQINVITPGGYSCFAAFEGESCTFYAGVRGLLTGDSASGWVWTDASGEETNDNKCFFNTDGKLYRIVISGETFDLTWSAGRVRTVVDSFGHDVSGRVVAALSRQRQAAYLGYHTSGNVQLYRGPDGCVTKFTYDADYRTPSATDLEGDTLYYDYDS